MKLSYTRSHAETITQLDDVQLVARHRSGEGSEGMSQKKCNKVGLYTFDLTIGRLLVDDGSG